MLSSIIKRYPSAMDAQNLGPPCLSLLITRCWRYPQAGYEKTYTCKQPPAGRTRWTLRLLADRLVALDVVDRLSSETVRLTLKKTNSSRS